MLSLTHEELKYLRILIVLTLILGTGVKLFSPQRTHLTDVVPTGTLQISTGREPIIIQEIEQTGNTAPDHVIINEATHADLMACPGIGSVTASLIIAERRFGKFFDWRDLDTRVKNISTGKIKTLQEAGVRINR